MGKTSGTIFLLLGLFLGFVMLSFSIYTYYIDYTYENAIGSYMDTSVDTLTPESFKEQVLLCKEAMIKAGLTEDDYGAMWFKKYDNSMKFQFQHLDSIVERADAMIQWRDTVYNNGQVTQPGVSAEAFRDVYSDKINQLRNYINEGQIRSDWIAEDAWMVKYHPVMYLFAAPALMLGWLCVLALFGIAIGFYNDWE